MDHKLKADGDIDTYMISGNDEIFQRAYIAIKMIKGSFLYNRNIGSDISSYDDDDIIIAKAREALVGIPEAEVINIIREENEIYVTVEINGQREELNVIQLR